MLEKERERLKQEVRLVDDEPTRRVVLIKANMKWKKQ
jgi:hypothetical protein